MELMAMGEVSVRATTRRVYESWSTRLGRLWMMHRERDPACVLDGLTLHPKRPVAHLDAAAPPQSCGVVLLLDHAHPGAMATLRTVQATHPHRIDAGSIVVGVENLPAGEADALLCYRRAARVPLFAVDLERTGDRLLLQEALVATRVAAALYRDGRPAARVSPGTLPT